MGVVKKQFGVHEDVLFIEFGSGDISFTKAKYPETSVEKLLIFNHHKTPREIGETSNEFTGKSTDDMEQPDVVFYFDNPESVNALINSLIELQMTFFK